jgi:phage gpG-like protein
VSSTTITIAHDDITPSLLRMQKAGKNLTPVFRAMGTTFKSITEGTFNSVGASYRPLPWPAKRDGSPSILQKSTTLAKSFHLEVTATYAALKNPAVYAAIHQFGGTIKPKNGKFLRFVGSNGQVYFLRKVTIPARPFYPVLNGKLTPQAEKKIAAAGQRAIQRIAEGSSSK